MGVGGGGKEEGVGCFKTQFVLLFNMQFVSFCRELLRQSHDSKQHNYIIQMLLRLLWGEGCVCVIWKPQLGKQNQIKPTSECTFKEKQTVAFKNTLFRETSILFIFYQCPASIQTNKPKWWKNFTRFTREDRDGSIQVHDCKIKNKLSSGNLVLPAQAANEKINV